MKAEKIIRGIPGVILFSVPFTVSFVGAEMCGVVNNLANGRIIPEKNSGKKENYRCGAAGSLFGVLQAPAKGVFYAQKSSPTTEFRHQRSGGFKKLGRSLRKSALGLRKNQM